jgi:hypothetical protein
MNDTLSIVFCPEVNINGIAIRRDPLHLDYEEGLLKWMMAIADSSLIASFK